MPALMLPIRLSNMHSIGISAGSQVPFAAVVICCGSLLHMRKSEQTKGTEYCGGLSVPKNRAEQWGHFILLDAGSVRLYKERQQRK